MKPKTDPQLVHIPLEIIKRLLGCKGHCFYYHHIRPDICQKCIDGKIEEKAK